MKIIKFDNCYDCPDCCTCDLSHKTELDKEGIPDNCPLSDAPEPKTSVEDFADTIKTDPAKIIEWANREIAEYQKLIKILEK